MRRPNVISTSNIPASIPKKQRARLLRMQHEKVKKQLRTKYFVWEPQTMKVVTPYNFDLNPVGMNAEFANLLNSIEVKWRIHCYVLSRQKNGKNDVDCKILDINTPCKRDDIAEFASEFHWNMVEEFRANKLKQGNFITAAWIATMIDNIPNEAAYEIFRKIGVWDLPADWEEERNGKK